MSYDEFLDTILSSLKETLGEDYQFRVNTLPKNNGATVDGLFLIRPGEQALPVVYLNPYYGKVREGRASIEQALAEILDQLRNARPPAAMPDDLSDFNQVRDRIMFRLIHTESNPTILSDVPSIPFLDLSIVFYLSLEHRGNSQMTALIHRSHIRQWNMDEKALWNLARENTPREYPVRVMPMQNVLQRFCLDLPESSAEASSPIPVLDETDTPPLYVVTNSYGLYGSACILYPDMLRKLSDRLDANLVLLPSSVHEVLVMPGESDTPYDDLSEMVTTINRQQVDGEDQLSNQVYLYKRNDRLIHLMTAGPRLVGHSGA